MLSVRLALMRKAGMLKLTQATGMPCLSVTAHPKQKMSFSFSSRSSA